MGLLGGIVKLSEIEIDDDKDWQGKEITNLKAIADGMVKGDIAFRGTDIMERLAATYGSGFNFLQVVDIQKGLGWGDILDMIIYLTGAENRIIAPIALSIPKPTISVDAVADASGGGHTAAPPTLSIPVPSIEILAALTPVHTRKTYNFVGITSPSGVGQHYGEQGECDVSDIKGQAFTPNGTSVTEFDQAGYDAIEADDETRHTTADPGSGDNAFYRFRFKVDEAVGDIRYFIAKWVGYAKKCSASYPIRLCIYNETLGKWEEVANGWNITEDVIISGYVHPGDVADYIDVDGYVWLCVFNRDDDEELYANYVELVVDYEPS